MLITFAVFLYLALMGITFLLGLWRILVPSMADRIQGIPGTIVIGATVFLLASVYILMPRGFETEVVAHTHEAVIGEDAQIINSVLELTYEDGSVDKHEVAGLSANDVDLNGISIAVDTIRYDLGILYALTDFGEAKTLRIIGYKQ